MNVRLHHRTHNLKHGPSLAGSSCFRVHFFFFRFLRKQNKNTPLAVSSSAMVSSGPAEGGPVLHARPSAPARPSNRRLSAGALRPHARLRRVSGASQARLRRVSDAHRRAGFRDHVPGTFQTSRMKRRETPRMKRDV